MSRVACGVFCGLVVLAVSFRAFAHDFTPGVLSLSERSPGTFDLRWTPPVDSRSRVVPGFRAPEGCVAESRTLSCSGGPAGEIVFTDMLPEMQVVVVVRRLDGTSTEARVAGADARYRLGAPVTRVATWLVLGVEHILGGLDHVAFVLGLLLLVEGRRRLFLTITAFTVAHSATLALAALDWVRLPGPPVEATIAASVLLVAREAWSARDTLGRRAPWVVALVFGLVHGLGFAGALAELGLPPDARASSLFLFNLGVELGQIAIVAVVLGTLQLALHWHVRATWVRPVACYVIGSVAAYWFVERTAAILLG